MDSKIEHRILNREELDILLKESDASETAFLSKLSIEPFDLFNKYSLIQDGMLIDKRPIYIAALIENNGKKEFWTIVNSNINCVIILSRLVRDELRKWIKEFGELYATMSKVNEKNMQWVQWLGFNKISETAETVTYRIGV